MGKLKQEVLSDIKGIKRGLISEGDFTWVREYPEIYRPLVKFFRALASKGAQITFGVLLSTSALAAQSTTQGNASNIEQADTMGQIKELQTQAWNLINMLPAGTYEINAELSLGHIQEIKKGQKIEIKYTNQPTLQSKQKVLEDLQHTVNNLTQTMSAANSETSTTPESILKAKEIVKKIQELQNGSYLIQLEHQLRGQEVYKVEIQVTDGNAETRALVTPVESIPLEKMKMSGLEELHSKILKLLEKQTFHKVVKILWGEKIGK